MYSRYRTHVCLISKEATPNLTPILDDGFRPEFVLMLVSPQMRDCAARLAAVYRRFGVKSREVDIADPFDLQEIESTVFEIISAEPLNEDIALNVTGGTKPMAIAAEHAFAVAGMPVFYVHPTLNQIVFLGDKTPPRPLANRLKIDEYLLAHGYEVKSSQRQSQANADRKLLTNTLISNAERYSRSISQLNWLAAKAESNRSLKISDPLLSQADADLTGLLQQIEHCNLARIAHDSIEFSNEEARFYLNGGWLEQHIFELALSIAKKQDAVCNLRIGWQGKSENEIDVAILANNRLHLIECKAKRFDRGEGKAAESLYKLDALTGLGGLNTRGMLISYLSLPASDINRAKDLGIRVVHTEHLRNLKSILTEWVS